MTSSQGDSGKKENERKKERNQQVVGRKAKRACRATKKAKAT